MTNNEQPGSSVPDPATPRAHEPHERTSQPPPASPCPGAAYPPQVPPSQPRPNQPYSGQQPYAGQPYPGQPYPAQGYRVGLGAPQPPYGIPPVQPRRSNAPLMIGVGVGALVIALVAVFALTRSGPDNITSPLPQAAGASSAVQGYLEALANGDAASALAYAVVPPGDDSLLTNDVLAPGLRQAPITDIEVAAGAGTAEAQSVDANYRIGYQPVSATFAVTKIGTTWMLADVATSLNRTDLPGVALTINGVPVEDDVIRLFPGSYTLESSDPRITLSDASFLVQSPSDYPDTTGVNASLSSEGRDAIRAAAQKKLASCLKQHSLQPKGCGFGGRLPSGNQPRTSSIRWAITKGGTAMKKIKPTLDGPAATTATADVNVAVKCNLNSTNGRRWYGSSAISWVQARLTTDGVSVTFS